MLLTWINVKLMALLFIMKHMFAMNQYFVWMLELAVSVKTSPDKNSHSNTWTAALLESDLQSARWIMSKETDSTDTLERNLWASFSLNGCYSKWNGAQTQITVNAGIDAFWVKVSSSELARYACVNQSWQGLKFKLHFDCWPKTAMSFTVFNRERTVSVQERSLRKRQVIDHWKV